MANELCPKVRGIKQSTVFTTIEAMKNAQRKIDSLPLSEDPTPFEESRDSFRDELIQLSEKTITDLNDDPNLAQIVDGLDRAAKDARKSAESLKRAAKKIEDFTAVLSQVQGIVNGILDIAL